MLKNFTENTRLLADAVARTFDLGSCQCCQIGSATGSGIQLMNGRRAVNKYAHMRKSIITYVPSISNFFTDFIAKIFLHYYLNWNDGVFWIVSHVRMN